MSAVGPPGPVEATLRNVTSLEVLFYLKTFFSCPNALDYSATCILCPKDELRASSDIRKSAQKKRLVLKS